MMPSRPGATDPRSDTIGSMPLLKEAVAREVGGGLVDNSPPTVLAPATRGDRSAGTALTYGKSVRSGVGSRRTEILRCVAKQWISA
jgi:hypothetical protein